MTIIETLLFGAGCLLLGAGCTACVRFGRADKPKRKRVADRKARREELRHRAEPDEPETTDTTADEDTAEVPALTGYQRWGNGGMDAAVAMRARTRAISGESARMRATAAEIDASSPGLFAAAYGPTAEMRQVFAAMTADVRLPVYEQVVSDYPTGSYVLVGGHPDGPGSDDPTIPADPLVIRSKRKGHGRRKHTHGGAR